MTLDRIELGARIGLLAALLTALAWWAWGRRGR